MENELNLTASQKARIKNLDYTQLGIGLAGSIAGVVYSNRTGGGFWRGVGYWIVGGLLIGGPAAIIVNAQKNKILKEAEANK